MSYIKRGITSILNQNLFDEDYYKKNYGQQLHDKNYLNHYIYSGYKEGKNPSKDFDTIYYLQRYPDIGDMNPLIHYALWGKKEHRFKSLDMELNYIKLGIQAILDQNLFDESFYKKNYSDEIHEMDPLSHYISYGYKEGKNPSPLFETNFYSIKYHDVWNQNPLIHYALYGRNNGNFTNDNQLKPNNDLEKSIKIIKENHLFDCESYLNRYSDVKKSGMCPVEHYMKFGFNEHRRMEPEYELTDYASVNKLDSDLNPLIHFLLNNNFKNLKIKKSLNDCITSDIKNYLESKYFVSVIMPTYNRENVIKNAIDSVISQTFSSYELIIIDDGSTDGTENFLKNEYNSLLTDKKIKYIKTNNNGVSKARNIGLNNSNGNVIAYLDSDNIWHPDYLEKMIYVLDKSNSMMAYSAIKVHDNTKSVSITRESTFDRTKLLEGNYIDLNIFMHKKSLFDKFGGFDEELTRLVDWDLILRYTENYEPYFLNEILAEYYLDSSLNNISHTVNLDENKEKIMDKYSITKVAKKQNKLNIAYVLWDFPAFSQTFVINELRWLVENGYNVKVFYSVDPDKKADIDFDLEYYKINNELDLENRLKEYSADVIHTHFVYPAGTLLTYPLAEKLKIPFTIFAHAIDIFLYDNAKRNKVDELSRSKFCIKILTLGDYHYDYLVEQGVSNDKILLSRQATNYSIENTILKDDPRFKRNMKNIISIGRFVEKKGWDTFIEAANLLKNDEFIFKIYGYGPLENEIKNKIRDLSLKNVKFEGVLAGEDVKKAYLEGDLFVSPNKIAKNGDRDGMPTVLFEAMAYGIPVISTNLVTIPEFIKNNQSGFIIEPDNPQALASKIKEVSNLSTNKLFSIVKNAQYSVQNITSVEKTMNTLLRLWKNERIGIFLVTYHSDNDDLDTISEILDRIYRYTTTPFDLLVVDNNSDEKFKVFLKEYSNEKENMDVILLNSNVFCGPASNIALNKLNNEFIIYICSNEGFIIKPGWELNAVDLMKNNPKMGIAGNLVSSPSFFNAESYKNNAWFKKARNRRFIEHEFKKPLKHVQGGCFILRKEIFDKIGGFNPKLPQGHMDVEYSYFIGSEGWELGQVPDWISLTTKTLPNVYSYIDQDTSLAHPLVIDDVTNIDEIIYDNCNICGGKINDNEKCIKCGSNRFFRSIYRILGKSDKIYRNLRCSFILNGVNIPKIFNKMFKIVNGDGNIANFMKKEMDKTNVIITDYEFNENDYECIFNEFFSILLTESLLLFKLSDDEYLNHSIQKFLKEHNFKLIEYKFNLSKLDTSKFQVAFKDE